VAPYLGVACMYVGVACMYVGVACMYVVHSGEVKYFKFCFLT